MCRLQLREQIQTKVNEQQVYQMENKIHNNTFHKYLRSTISLRNRQLEVGVSMKNIKIIASRMIVRKCIIKTNSRLIDRERGVPRTKK